MGIYMSSYAMIGVIFTPYNKEIVRSVRGCEHPELESKHCPECGKSMFVPKKQYESQIEDIEETYNLDECITEHMYILLKEHFGDDVVATRDFDGDNYYFGYGLSVENHEVKRVDIPDYEYIKNALLEALDQYGLSEQCGGSFGFWAISVGG